MSDSSRTRITRAPLLVRILAANAAVVLLGAVVGTILTRQLAERSTLGLMLAFAALGVGLSLLLNYLVLRRALRPLSDLTRAVDRIEVDPAEVRLTMVAAEDPDLSRLTTALNTMLDRVAAYAATIDANRQSLRTLSLQVISAQGDERKRIARVLHGETSQWLASLRDLAGSYGARFVLITESVGRYPAELDRNLGEGVILVHQTPRLLLY